MSSTEYIGIDEEADHAECETCNIQLHRKNGIECEGCGGWICWQCWKGVQHGKDPHFCGKLTDRKGQLIRLGDQIVYPLREEVIYRVTDMPETFIKNMICYGERLRGSRGNEIIRPRLMEHI